VKSKQLEKADIEIARDYPQSQLPSRQALGTKFSELPNIFYGYSGCHKYVPFGSNFKRTGMVVTVSSTKTTAILFL
jgi:hypothetical protein